MPKRRERKVFVFCVRRAGRGNFSLTRNSLLIRVSVWQTYPTAGSISCIFPLNRPHRCQSSGNARSIRRLRKPVLSSITPTSVPTPYYWVPRVQEVAKEHGIPFKVIHITDKESAQNVPAPVTTYALFRDGQFLTQGIQSDKKFLALSRPFT